MSTSVRAVTVYQKILPVNCMPWCPRITYGRGAVTLTVRPRLRRRAEYESASKSKGVFKGNYEKEFKKGLFIDIQI
jgi:hypothetical protein